MSKSLMPSKGRKRSRSNSDLGEASNASCEKVAKEDINEQSSFILPVEILEKIFYFLSAKDLESISLVSLLWRELQNSDKLWYLKCKEAGMANEEVFKKALAWESNIAPELTNSNKHAEAGRLTPVSYWKTHFHEYKLLESNWKSDKFYKSETKFEPLHCDGELIFDKQKGYNVRDLDVAIFDRSVAPGVGIDDFRAVGDLLFYTQDDRVICMKKGLYSFEQKYVVSLPDQPMVHEDIRDDHPNKPRLNTRVSGSANLIVIQDLKNPCFIYLYTCETGLFIRQVPLHGDISRNSPCAKYTFLEISGNTIFLAGNLSSRFFIQICNRSKEEPLIFDIPEAYDDIVVSENYVCTTHGAYTLRRLIVWSNTGSKLKEVITVNRVPIVITPDERLVYHEFGTLFKILKLTSLNTRREEQSNFQFFDPHSIIDIKATWCNLIVILHSECLLIWDPSGTRQPSTLYHINHDSIFFERMWVNDRHIVIKFESMYRLPSAGYVFNFSLPCHNDLQI